jgi:hypothetical protein
LRPFLTAITFQALSRHQIMTPPPIARHLDELG